MQGKPSIYTTYKHNGIAKSINDALTVLFYVGAWAFILFNYFQRIFPCWEEIHKTI